MASYDKTIIVPGGILSMVFEYCIQALNQMEAQITHTDAVRSRLTARTGFSVWSTGETIEVTVVQQESSSNERRHLIKVTSSNNQMTAWGKNQSNAEAFEAAFWNVYPGTTTTYYGDAPTQQPPSTTTDDFKDVPPSKGFDSSIVHEWLHRQPEEPADEKEEVSEAKDDDAWLTDNKFYDPYAFGKKPSQSEDAKPAESEQSPSLMEQFNASLNQPVAEPQTRSPRIFMSYRRADSADVSGRMYDRLVAAFGREAIFKDVDSIPFGVNFVDYLDEQVKQCDVLLAIIGRHWAGITYEDGPRKGQLRLHDPQDFVRIEIESALKRGITVVPIYVSGAHPPSIEELPEALHDLVWRNGTQVRPDPDFHNDMNRLIEGLQG